MKPKRVRTYRGCGIDIDKKWLWACILSLTVKNRQKTKFKQFSNDAPGIDELKKWLTRNKVTHVAFESTGVYWQMLYDKLFGHFDVVVGNPHQMKGLRGYKTDRGDGLWIATILSVGAIKPSFIPPRPIRELRLLTRQYHNLVQDRTRFKNRIKKTLRQAGITIDGCMNNLFCDSGRAMIRALMSCEDADTIASLGSKLKASRDTLLEALDNAPLPKRYRMAISRYYAMLVNLDAELAELWEEIEETVKPYAKWIALLETIPGIAKKIAIYIIAEMGVDMSVFPTVKNLASWVGACSGNNSSGGKRKNGRATKGNKYLRYALIEAAWAAIRTKGSSYRDYYYSNKARLGHKNKAAFAVAHRLLRACYSVLKNEKEYTDTCSDDVQKRMRRVRRNLRMITTEELEQELEQRRIHEEMNSVQLEASPLPV